LAEEGVRHLRHLGKLRYPYWTIPWVRRPSTARQAGVPEVPRDGRQPSSGAGAGEVLTDRTEARGAHLLLQTRVQVLNDDLRKTFGRWFPGMRAEEQAAQKHVA
jgi:hypothetical protein